MKSKLRLVVGWHDGHPVVVSVVGGAEVQITKGILWGREVVVRVIVAERLIYRDKEYYYCGGV